MSGTSDSKSKWVVCGDSCGVKLQCRIEAGRKNLYVKLRRNQSKFGVQEQAIEYFVETVAARAARVAGDADRTPPGPADYSFLREPRPNYVTEAVAEYLWRLGTKASASLEREGLPLDRQQPLMLQLAEWLHA